MADAATHTEAWSDTLETPELSTGSQSSDPEPCSALRRDMVSVSRTSGLTSRMMRKDHVRFCNGRGWGNPPPDRNPMIVGALYWANKRFHERRQQRSTSDKALHSSRTSGSSQPAEKQTWLAGHSWPQPPQLLASRLVSTHTPPHSVKPWLPQASTPLSPHWSPSSTWLFPLLSRPSQTSGQATKIVPTSVIRFLCTCTLLTSVIGSRASPAASTRRS